MAIKVKGTTVIDDYRNLVNINDIAASAIEKTYNLASIQAVDVYDGSDSNGWELRTNLSYNNEAVPSGVYLGQYASVSAAVTAGGAVGDWFYNTADTYFYEITATGTPAASRIYRAGSSHLPLVRAAVAVDTGTSARLIIFDLTDGNCSMWMEFRGNTINNILRRGANSLKWAGNFLYISHESTFGVVRIDWARDKSVLWSASIFYTYKGSILERSDGLSYINSITSSDYLLPNNNVNAIANYTAPDAPLDSVTGMPIPIIAASTNGGLCVILEDGTVSSASSTTANGTCGFDDNGILYSSTLAAGLVRIYGATPEIYRTDSFDLGDPLLFSDSTTPALSNDGTNVNSLLAVYNGTVISKSGDRIDVLRPNPNTTASSLIAKIGTNFNTGWMVDPTAAVLCDTDTGSIGYPEKITNGGMESNSDWGEYAAGNSPVSQGQSAAQAYTGTYSWQFTTNSNYQGMQSTTDFSVTAGVPVEIQFAVYPTSDTGVWFTFHDGTAQQIDITGLTQSAWNLVKLSITPANTSSTAYLAWSTELTYGSGTWYIDDVSVKETIVANGTFDTDAYWTKTAGVTISGGVANFSGVNSQNALYQSIGMTSGKWYKLTFDMTQSGGELALYAALSSATKIAGWTTSGSKSLLFQASGANLVFYGLGGSGFTGTVDNVSVQAVAEDYSGQDNHATVTGNVPGEAITPGGIVFRGPMDKSNHLEFSSNPLASAGTSDWEVDICFKKSFSISEAMFFQSGDWDGANYTGGIIRGFIRASGELLVLVSDDGAVTDDRAQSIGRYNDGKPHVATFYRNGSIIGLVVDGVDKVETSLSDAVGSLSNSGNCVIGTTQAAGSMPSTVIGMVKPRLVYTGESSIKKRHQDTLRILESGSVTLPNTITDAFYDERHGVTRLLDSDSQERLLNGLVIESTRDLDAGDSVDVGTVAAGAASGRSRIVGGSTALLIEQDEKNLREEGPVSSDYKREEFQYVGDGSNLQFPKQSDQAQVSDFKGWKPVAVKVNGVQVEKGVDWTLEYDGFNYWAEFVGGTTIAATDDVFVDAVKENYK